MASRRLDAKASFCYTVNMNTANTAISKTTIYLDPTVKKFLQHKAIEEETSISDLINERFEEEMASDKLIALIEERKREPTISFEEALKECGLTYADLQD